MWQGVKKSLSRGDKSCVSMEEQTFKSIYCSHIGNKILAKGTQQHGIAGTG